MCRHREDAEDVAQNSLMKAAQKIDGFRGEASVRTWLHTIATNECRMLRRRVTPSPFDEALAATLAANQKAKPYAPEQSPESLAIEAENRREVVAALDQLPERYQQVIVLKDGCGLRAAEVARVLNTTVPAVRSVLFRARRMLRSHLGPLEPLA
jgi:RNA polymerase sigma-70 factor (ECF subfamily)